MKLHHRMLRHFIAASVIVLTSSFLIFELVASDRAMSAYLRYIVQKADSSFLYDKYQNQSIAAHVMRALAAEQCRQNSGAPSARLLSLPIIPMA